MLVRAHKIRLRPTPKQEIVFRQCVGVSRFAYNWALEQWSAQYKAGEKPCEQTLRRQLNGVKREQFPWMLDVPKSVAQQAVKNLGTAFKNMFKKRGKYPRFKSRHRDHQSARLDNGPGTFQFNGKAVKLPRIGWVRTFETLRWSEAKPISCVLRREGERWFLSVAVEIAQINQPACVENQDAVGIDLGITTAVTLSTGEKIDAPKPLKKLLSTLARRQRHLSRTVKGSNNRKKVRAKVARLFWHIQQARYDWQHKLTTMLARRFSPVYVEDLNVRGMMLNHNLARSISDIGWCEIVRQLDYKTRVRKVDRWFPSSKTCSACGFVVRNLTLDIRDWTCPICSAVHDRDVNAARNILAEGLRTTASCAGSNACGDGSSGAGSRSRRETTIYEAGIGLSRLIQA